MAHHTTTTNGHHHHPPSLHDIKHPRLLYTLPPSLLPKPNAGPDSPRLIVIGDVHGQLTELDTLLSKAGYESARGDQVVFTGDMVNKGPNSGGVIDRAIAMGAWGVRGNHEDRVLRAWARREKKREKKKNKNKNKHHKSAKADDDGISILEEKEDEDEDEVVIQDEAEDAEDTEPETLSKSDLLDLSTASSLTPRQLTWLASLPVILRVGTFSPHYGEIVVVHAGLVPGVPLDKQDPWAVMNMRTLLPTSSSTFSTSTSTPTNPDEPDLDLDVDIDLDPDVDTEATHKKHPFKPSEGREGHPWASIWNDLEKAKAKKNSSRKGGGNAQRTTVVYGHDAKKGLSIRRYAFGLDSGCVRGGELTALVFESASPPSVSTFESEERRGDVGRSDDDEVKEQVKHRITHRLVSIACEAAVFDDENGDESKDRHDDKEDQ
ncbi:hypothetical protein M426DRAFT_318076 [Hypoxylon sp. CI-4A]|nr:hypothetical protein M426DRAFT_318076 [Hypoxylon sp. CI-4A]